MFTKDLAPKNNKPASSLRIDSFFTLMNTLMEYFRSTALG